MWCEACKNELVECVCSDKDERIKSIMATGNFFFRMCTICGKHYARCKCENPIWIGSTKEREDENV